MNDTDKIYELSDKYQKAEAKQGIDQTEKELEKLLKPYQNGSVGIAQINPIAGNIEYNSTQVVKYINHAQNIGLDLVVFPELTLTGYPLEDTLSKYPVLAEENRTWLNEIAKITINTAAIVGFIEPCKINDTLRYYNSAALLAQGKIIDIVRKSQISECEFNDNKYFIPGNKPSKIHTINNIKYGIFIGDDIEQVDFKNNLPDVLINISAIPIIEYKKKMTNNLLSKTAQKYSLPIVFANPTGATDCVTFCGNSTVYDKNGKIFANTKICEEQFLIVNLHKNLGKIYTDSKNYTSEIQESFSLNYEPDLARTYKILIQGIKDYFFKTGFKRAVLGLSGGLDSTICAVLLADALGKENVFGISMPSKITSETSKNDALILAQNLGIHFAQAPIKEMFDTTNNCLQKLFQNVEKEWDCRYKKSFTPDNIQARSRAMFLWGISNEFGSCLPIATSDKSEAYMGYATINGDMSGGYAPIADITKTKLFALAKWLNKNRPEKNAIPQSIIEKKPGAELAIDPNTNKPLIAEDALMPYEFLDEVIWRIENKQGKYEDMLNSQFLYETTHTITQEQKSKWLEKFYKRMAGALYKRTIMPPYVIVDSPSYNFKQPITSSKINYKNSSEVSIEQKIQEMM